MVKTITATKHKTSKRRFIRKKQNRPSSVQYEGQITINTRYANGLNWDNELNILRNSLYVKRGTNLSDALMKILTSALYCDLEWIDIDRYFKWAKSLIENGAAIDIDILRENMHKRIIKNLKYCNLLNSVITYQKEFADNMHKCILSKLHEKYLFYNINKFFIFYPERNYLERNLVYF